MYKSSRLAAGRFYVDDTWITGGVAYGYAERAQTVAVREASEQLLQELTVQIIVKARGPRFIAGDFNQEQHVLREPRLWERHGFVELQDLFMARSGIKPSVTCKGTTRKDFMFVSSELATLLMSVHLDDTLFTDLSALYALIRHAKLQVPKQVWRIPHAIDWQPKLQTKVCESNSLYATGQSHNPTRTYQQLCQTFEQDVQQCRTQLCMPSLAPFQLGRGATHSLSLCSNHATPLKPSRYGERVPEFQGSDLEYKRCFGQLRRLVNYCRLARQPALHPASLAHKIALWSAICRAPGFGNSFASWWHSTASTIAGARVTLPHSPPSAAIAEALRVAVEK